MKKQQSFATFTKSYRPLRFKFMGIPVSEHMPRQTHFDLPHLSRIRLKSALGLPITYFDLRASLTPVGKKTADLAFLTHIVKEHDRGAEDVPRGELIRYHMIRLRYLPELRHISSRIGIPEADNYVLRWGYLLDVSPSFVELIHGTDNAAAWYALENLQ